LEGEHFGRRTHWEENALERKHFGSRSEEERFGRRTRLKENALERKHFGRRTHWEGDALAGERTAKKTLFKENPLGKRTLRRENTCAFNFDILLTVLMNLQKMTMIVGVLKFGVLKFEGPLLKKIRGLEIEFGLLKCGCVFESCYP